MTTAQPQPQPAGHVGAEDARRWRIFSVGLATSFMGLFDLSVVNVTLPSIERALATGHSALQWVVSGYALTFALALVPAGRLGDARGRRFALLFGLAVFTASSAMAGLAQSGVWLVAARLAQGAGAGILSPQIPGLIEELFPVRQRGRPFGVLGATASVATTVGPVIGGLLVAAGGAAHGWRLVFLVNVPIGIAVTVLTWRLAPTKPVRGHTDRQRHDLVGTLLLGAGVTFLMLPALQREEWRGQLPWLLVPVGVGILIAFRYWETSRAPRYPPIFDFRLLQGRSYRLGMVMGFFYYAGFTPLPLLVSLHLQNGLHRSPLHAGLAVAPFAVGSTLGALLGGRQVNRLGRPLIAAGLVTVMASLTVLALLSDLQANTFSLVNAFPLLLAGIGSGLVLTSNNTLTLAQVPEPDAGSAAGMYETARRTGSAIGLAMVTAALFAALEARDGRWSTALQYALVLQIGIIAAALLTAIVDVVGARHDRQGRAH
ncbi:MFS transporter [Micromonospora sp. WMMA1363]|uniref:MFS transporter n=1 Tax=Micromonospora sp. WMMA1363 TaxID=3053985 RepID=UPI00259D2D01|nr:MFS transporter [Micromonospora sp. WMMA1363]MDM4719574.1 MFS transporter [Micromonospora sp. WMMA1363]